MRMRSTLVVALCLATFASAGGRDPAAASASQSGRIRRVLRPTFKPLARDSVVVLIGDLPWPGGSVQTLKNRIGVAADSGADTVLLVCDTRNLEGGFDTLDALLRLAAGRSLSVMPRIIVDSAAFTERVAVTEPFPEQLPAYANADQLAGALALLTTVIDHFETFPNVVAYQVEWGHYGESWINAPFWDSPSSTAAFLAALHSSSPQFAGFTAANVADWAFGGVMAPGDCWPEGDVRRQAINVAEFHAYQQWRYQTTRSITWALRERAGTLTSRPIAGFSYVIGGPDGVIGHAYTAGQHLDVAFSDWTPMPGTAHHDFIRDAGFAGLHLVELDFDTPYFQLPNAAEAVAALASRGIVPVIFDPAWSSALSDADIPVLVALIKANPTLASPLPADVLLVLGHQAIGVGGLTSIGVLGDAGAAITADSPPGIMPLLLSWGLSLDAASPDVYTAALGDRYRLVLVGSPLDEPGSAFQQQLAATTSPVLIAHPSFLVGLPTVTDPVAATSGYCSAWNPITIGGRTIGVQVRSADAPPETAPALHFVGALAPLGSIPAFFTTRRAFSYYQGEFDEVMATVEFAGASYPAIGRMGNIVMFGLSANLLEETQRARLQQALAGVLAGMGIAVPPSPTTASPHTP